MPTISLPTPVNDRVVKQDVNPEPYIQTPTEIYKILEESVTGQEHAKKVLSVAMHQHLQRTVKEVEADKSNILLTGPTGSGKTYLVKTLAKVVGLPLVILDASSFSATGYQGRDTDSLAKALYEEACLIGDPHLATCGIVFIDEVDKIKAVANPNGGRDVSGRSVQEGLLKAMEGGDVAFKTGSGQEFILDTSNVLFVFAGAFEGLEDITRERIAKERKLNDSVIGFQGTAGIQDLDVSREIPIQQDLVEFGIIPEFIGRIPNITKLNTLTVNNLINILTKVKGNLIGQYTELLKDDGIKLSISVPTLRKIATLANTRGVGARGLRSITEELLRDVMFTYPGSGKDIAQVTARDFNKVFKTEE